MAKRKTSTRAKDQQTMAAGNAPASAVNYGIQRRQENPTDINAVFTRCRTVVKRSTFLTSYYDLVASFWNYGLKFTIGPGGDKNDEAMLEWEKEEFKVDSEYTDPNGKKTTIEINSTKGEVARAFVEDAVNEFMLLSNCVGFWNDAGSAPITLAPEQCRYTDTMGLPVLFYRHGLSVQQIAILPDEQKKRFADNPELLLSPDEGEHFKVIKRGLIGTGFSTPPLQALFNTLGEVESKELGFHALAYLMRGATRHHKLGHEIKQGAHAGKPSHFMTSRRGNAVLKQFENRQGPHEFTSNFDHTIEFPWPDMEVFDETAWKGTNLQFATWGGVLAQALVREKIVDGGLHFLRAQATKDRQKLADFLRPIIVGALKPPEGFRVTWSDLIFIDPKQATDLIKFCAQTGAASVSTVRRIAGMSDEEENANKVHEADDKDAHKKFRPAWDMSHGFAPNTGQVVDTSGGGSEGASGADPGKRNGRPPGAATGS
jgi:hypothetical protein